MADEKGLSVLLKVGVTASSPASYTVLEGQTDGSFDGSVNVADTTAKDNSGWQTGVATTRSGTVTASGNLRDTRPMLDLLQAAWIGGTTHACQLIIDAAGNGFAGDFYVTAFNISGATSDVAKYSVTLTPSAALTEVSP